jgi:hypothetical protein
MATNPATRVKAEENFMMGKRRSVERMRRLEDATLQKPLGEGAVSHILYFNYPVHDSYSYLPL